MTIKPFYTLSEVAGMIGKSTRTVERWVESGSLTTVQIGKRPHVPIDALRAHAMVWNSIVTAAKLNAARPAA